MAKGWRHLKHVLCPLLGQVQRVIGRQLWVGERKSRDMFYLQLDVCPWAATAPLWSPGLLSEAREECANSKKAQTSSAVPGIVPGT